MTAGVVPGADVVHRAQRGDMDAFAQLYRAHAPGILLLCRRMTGADKADELMQDVFVRAWQQLGSFRGESAFATWLHRLGVNVILNALRSAKRDELRFSDEGDEDDWPVPESASLERRLNARMDIDAAVAQLPLGARTVFVLYDIQGYSHAEIAEQLGVAGGTVRAQLWRARRLLMKLLDQ